MHDNSYALMNRLLTRYASKGDGRLAYDVGSYDVNGNYRLLLQERGWKCFGIDIAQGPNVDIVVPERGEWPDIAPASLIISGQCLEHTRRPWRWFSEMQVRLYDNGILIIIAPSSWPEHKYPLDCWRILPDGMRVLAEDNYLEVLEVGLSYAQRVPYQGEPNRRDGEDCFAVMRKTRPLKQAA